MRIICLSDLHGNLPPSLPEGDLILLAGDICPDSDQKRWLFGEFAAWAECQPVFILAVWGNHDFIGQKIPRPMINNVAFVHDEKVSYKGVTIYGTPWSLWTADWCKRWAFMRKDSAYREMPKVDIVISHGPPYGCGDRCEDGFRAGSQALRENIVEICPKLVVCGHIHEDAGMHILEDTPVINASYVNLHYVPGNKIFTYDVDE